MTIEQLTRVIDPAVVVYDDRAADVDGDFFSTEADQVARVVVGVTMDEAARACGAHDQDASTGLM